jgi:amino acid efflux transporter
MIGVKEGIALYVTSVLGGGILTLPSLAAAAAGPASILSWIIVTVMSLPLAVMFGRLSAAYPDAGGMSSFVRRAYGKRLGDLTAWLYLSIIPVAQPAIAMTGLYYVAYLYDLPKGWIIGISYGMLCCAIGVCLLGKRLSARVQLGIVAATVAIIVATSLLGFRALNPQHFSVVFPNGYWAVGSAAGLIIWCYVGVENLSFISSDFRDPRRDLLKCILIGTLIVAALYVTVSIVVIGVLTPSEWGRVKAPFVYVLNRSVGAGFAYAAVPTGLFITFASAITIAWGGSNLCSSMAERGSLPTWLARRTSNGVAYAALAFLWSLYSLSAAGIYYYDLDLERLAQSVGITVIITYIFSAFAYFRLLDHHRWSAAVTLVSSLCLLPFLRSVAVYPLAVAGLYLLYAMTQRAAARVERPSA